MSLEVRDDRPPRDHQSTRQQREPFSLPWEVDFVPLFGAGCLQRTLLEGYAKNPTDHLAAFSTIARNMRMMYAHAYQSYVWNHMVSERLKLGLTAVAGDLVLVPPAATSMLGKRKAEADAAEVAEGSGREEAGTGTGANEEEGSGSADGGASGFVMKQVKVLTAEEAARTSLFDVVMPLPGVAVSYPTHAVGLEKYRAKMAEDGVDVDDMHHSHKAYNLQGDYRHIVAR
jgi:tRNA pseudouridine13 synthase